MASELASERQASALPRKDTSSANQSAKGNTSAGTGSIPQAENTPTPSPWWTAPAGRPVPIPAFGRAVVALARSWLEALLDLLMPKPVPVPVPVKVPATRRR